MQFFARIMAQMLQGPMGEKLANAQWMQKLARNTHQAMEKGGKLAAEQKIAWEQSRQALKTNSQQMKSEVNNSMFVKYIEGLKQETSQLKQQIKDELTKKS